MERLQKIIAKSGVTSRRKAEELITKGKVKVNGKIINQLGFCTDESAIIEVDGKVISKENLVYFVINKPQKVLCSVSDDRGRKTIIDCFSVSERIFPVGRLDYDTTGVLILTNDGDFANEIIHPRKHINKVYEVTINGILTNEDIKKLEKGIVIENRKTLPANVKTIMKNNIKKTMILEITIFEGRNRQIKKMIEYFGFKVTRLHRLSIGNLSVKDLKYGEYRVLKPFEIKQLKNLKK
ncbi:MAG: pseudouridine synthase [Anaerorhabdus sp.]